MIWYELSLILFVKEAISFLHSVQLRPFVLLVEVPSLGTHSQRQIPYVFDKPHGNAEDKRAVMANITTPMTESVTFKKMLKKQAFWVHGPMV